MMFAATGRDQRADAAMPRPQEDTSGYHDGDRFGTRTGSPTCLQVLWFIYSQEKEFGAVVFATTKNVRGVAYHAVFFTKRTNEPVTKKATKRRNAPTNLSQTWKIRTHELYLRTRIKNMKRVEKPKCTHEFV